MLNQKRRSIFLPEHSLENLPAAAAKCSVGVFMNGHEKRGTIILQFALSN